MRYARVLKLLHQPDRGSDVCSGKQDQERKSAYALGADAARAFNQFPNAAHTDFHIECYRLLGSLSLEQSQLNEGRAGVEGEAGGAGGAGVAGGAGGW